MRQFTHALPVPTHGEGLYEITREMAARWQRERPVRTGLLTVVVRHTSASLMIQENADPDVIHDLNVFFNRLVAEDDRLYRHTVEGSDDMPAHIRALLTGTQLSIPVLDGQLALARGRACTSSSTARRRTGGACCCICWGRTDTRVATWKKPESAHDARVDKQDN